MADSVDSKVLRSGQRHYVVHLTNVSDGTGESAVAKVDISTLTDAAGRTATYSTVDFIEYGIQGFASVRLHWDHDTDDEIAVLAAGAGVIDWRAVGGSTDPKTTGGTGDIVLTTNGGASGSTYDITLHVRPRA